MKKYYILSLVLVAALGLSSCQDKLDLRDNGKIDMSQVFKDRNRTRGYLNSCYSYMIGVNFDAAAWSDDAQHSSAANAKTSYDIWYNSGVDASNFGSYNVDGSPWTSLFIGVRKTNVFLANIEGATGSTTAEDKANWTAQAHVLRAYYYLQLMKRYGQVPLITEDLGTTHDYSSDKKASITEITRQILADCDAAISAPDNEGFSYYMRTQQWGMMTKAIAQYIRCEAVMWAISPLLSDGGFSTSEAYDVANDALSKLTQNGYELWTEASDTYSAYANYFLYNPNDLRAKDKETILGGSQVAVWSNAGVPIVAGTTTAGPCPTQELVDAFEMANGMPAITGYSDANHLEPIVNSASGYNESKPYVGRDPRFYDIVFYNGSKRGANGINTATGGTCGINRTNVRFTHTGYYMRKYANNNSNRNSNQDGFIRTMRLAEVYYNFAEVALAAGKTAEAATAVNTVRARSGMPAIATADFNEARYRNDRRVEFALEADRYHSLRRWKTLSSASVVSGMDGGKRFAFEPRPTTTDKYLLYPLDLLEVNKVNELTGASWQNPGW